MSAPTKKFWMVAGSGPSSHRHESKGAAVREAKRLARHNEGAEFYVVEAVSVHIYEPVQSTELVDWPQARERQDCCDTDPGF